MSMTMMDALKSALDDAQREAEGQAGTASAPLLDNPKAMRLHLVNLGDLLEGARSIYASGSRRGHGSAHGDKVDAIVLQALNWADAAANCLTEEECATAGGLGWAHERYLDDTPGDREKETTDENT